MKYGFGYGRRVYYSHDYPLRACGRGWEEGDGKGIVHIIMHNFRLLMRWDFHAAFPSLLDSSYSGPESGGEDVQTNLTASC